MNKLSGSILLLTALACAPGGNALAADPEPAPAAPAATPAKPAVKLADLFPDTPVAKGKGFEIKRSQLDDAVTSIKSTAVARGQSIPPQELVTLEQQVLDRLIQIQILLSKATDADKAKGKETSDKRFENVKTRSGNDAALDRQLKSVGLTQDQLRSKMLEEATAEAVLERELNVNVTEADVKKFYDTNPTQFEQPEMVRASHILLATKDQAGGTELTEAQKAAKHKKMEGLLKRARDGEDFTKLAVEFSEDPGVKQNDGEYTFPRGKMAPEFEAAAFSLKTNQVSEIVTTMFGYHIIKLSEKIPAKQVELAKVSQDIKDYLKGQAVRKDLPQFMEKAKTEANVQILDDKLKPAAASAAVSPPGAKPAAKSP